MQYIIGTVYSNVAVGSIEYETQHILHSTFVVTAMFLIQSFRCLTASVQFAQSYKNNFSRKASIGGMQSPKKLNRQ